MSFLTVLRINGSGTGHGEKREEVNGKKEGGSQSLCAITILTVGTKQDVRHPVWGSAHLLTDGFQVNIRVHLQEGAALMAQTIKIDQLADTVMKGMEEYAKLAAEDLKKDVQKAGKTVKQQIESTAPKKTGKYSKSWAVKKTRETSDSIQIVVHSKRYQLTHLLEFGHAKRGGGRTRAFPHIAPAEQAGIEQLTRDIERDLQKGG